MNKVVFSNEYDNWRTPKELMKWLALEQGFHPDLDVAASDGMLAMSHFSPETDALAPERRWQGIHVFCNPPYSKVKEFVDKALEEAYNRSFRELYMLLPARTDQAWFKQLVDEGADIIFLKGRVKFWLTPEELEELNKIRIAKGKKPLDKLSSAPFPSLLVRIDPISVGSYVEVRDWKQELSHYPLLKH